MSQKDTEFESIRCQTISDIVNKYTSKKCQEYYSYQLCCGIMDDSATEEGVSEVVLNRVNRAIHRSIDADMNTVYNKIRTEIASYLADMAQKGVVQLMGKEAIKKLRKLVADMDKVRDEFLDRDKRFIISSIREKSNDPDVHVSNYNQLFVMWDDTVREDLDYADKKITKLKGEFYSAFTDGLFDNLLGEEKPTKKRSKTTRGRS